MRLALAAAVAASLAFPVASSAQSTGGVIAYTRDGTVYVSAVDGTGETAWGPGEHAALAHRNGGIAYTVRAGGARQLWIGSIDSPEAPRQITRLPDREGEFGENRYGVTGAVWSPDDTRIAVRLMEGSTTTLGITGLDGSLTRFEFGHLFGSTVAWRDDESLVVGTDEGLRLANVSGAVTPVNGAAPGDTPVVFDDDRLVVNGSDGIALLDVATGERELLLAGATAWDSTLSVALLYTNDTEVGIVNPGDGAGTAPSPQDTLPAGVQVVGGIGSTSPPLLELADASGASTIWQVSLGVNLGSLGSGQGFAKPARASLKQVARGSGVTTTPQVDIGEVVPVGASPSAAPATPGATAAPSLPGGSTLAKAPGLVVPPEGRSAFAHALPAAGDVSTDGKTLLVNALITALLLLLITFPSELFNSTLEEHYDEVRGWFGRRGPRPEPAQRTRGQRALMFAGYTAAAALLYTLLDRHAGLDGATVRLWLGLAVGIVAVTFAFAAATLLFHRRRGSRGVLNVLPGTLVVAVACVVITRVTRFEPGYLYGVVGGFAFAQALPERDEGLAATLSAGWVFAAALLAWLVWQPVNAAASDGSPGLAIGLLDTTLSAIAIGGVQGLVIGLLPLRSLPGHTIARWDRRVWAASYAVVLFVFLHLLLHPSSGFGDDAHPVPFFTWLALFVGFGAVSVAFWGYFQRRPSSG